MISLLIDGLSVDIDEKVNPAITVSIADIEEPESTSAGYSKTVEVPFTPKNMWVFGYANELFSKEKFNNEMHTAEFRYDDTVVMSGVAQIEKITYKTGREGQVVGGVFHVTVIGSAYEWISNAKKPMNELRSDEVVKYTMEEIYKNSVRTDTSLIKFFPVDRGAFYIDNGGTEKSVRTTLRVLDYHPFINVWQAFKLIFNGFDIRSSMQPRFEKLYSAGQTPSIDDEEDINEFCNFCCGGEWDEYSNNFPNRPLDCFNEISGGDFFANGVLDKYSSGFDWWEPNYYTRYTPPRNVAVRFSMELNFQTRLYDSPDGMAPVRFVDKLHFGARPVMHGDKYDNIVEWRIEDSEEYKDYGFSLSRYDTLKTGSYMIRMSGVNLSEYTNVAIIFDADGARGWGSPTAFRNWNNRFFITAGRVMGLMLTQRDGTQVDAFKLTGFKIEMIPGGEHLTFNLKYTTDPIRCSPGNGYIFPCKFIRSWDASTSGRDVILGLCSLKPVFGPYIAKEDLVSIATVGGTGSQLDYLGALRQMFNLMFYTNFLTKEVVIEPHTKFYNLKRTDIIDWRGLVDYSESIEIQELGCDVGSSMKLAYTNNGSVIEKYNKRNNIELGACSIPLLNKTTEETKEIVNPVFAPFIVRNIASVGMTVPQNESEKTQDTIDSVDLDITPIIGHFAGTAVRTAGDDKTAFPQYPLLLFKDPSRTINLDFSDDVSAGFCPGLNQYYSDNISAYNHGRRLTLHLRLSPQDVEDMLLPTDLKRDLRAVFLLRVNGEDVPCLLEQICDYNPASGASTKCQFIIDPNIRLEGTETVVITQDKVAVMRNNTIIVYEGR